MRRGGAWIVLSAGPLLLGAAPAAPYDVEGKTIEALAADMAAGRVTSAELVAAYGARIASRDGALHSVIAINPEAARLARQRDAERAAGRVRGPLHGIPILVKDNIETADPLPTTAGSLALARNFARADAPAVARLKAAGAIVLGKTNLSEWANVRSSRQTSGWSAVGGQTVNARSPGRSPCGSSSGSAVAVAAGLAPAALGTETSGSIVCPASLNGVVGFKPTVGLVSQKGVVPVSRSQDSIGPITLTVDDAALLLRVMAAAPRHGRDLDRARTLRGLRIGVLRSNLTGEPAVDRAFDRSVQRLRALGVELVEIPAIPDLERVRDLSRRRMLIEMRTGLDDYLAATPRGVATRSLAQLVAFTRSTAGERPDLGQDTLEAALATRSTTPRAYRRLDRQVSRLSRGTIEKLLATQRLAALVAPTRGTAWRIDQPATSNRTGASLLPAVAGFPHLTVPAGRVDGLPVGLSFIGGAGREPLLLRLGAAFEKLPPPSD